MAEKTDAQIVGDALGRFVGSVAYYFVLRRLGAPRYVAYIAVSVNTRLYDITHPLNIDDLTAATGRLIDKRFDLLRNVDPFGPPDVDVDDAINKILGDA